MIGIVGLELTAQQRLGAWTLDGSAMLLSAECRNGQIDPALNGKRPTNVPDFVLRAGATLAIAQVPGLSVQARASHEGRRAILPDGSLELPAWTRLDAGLAYQTRLSNFPATWRKLGCQQLAEQAILQKSRHTSMDTFVSRSTTHSQPEPGNPLLIAPAESTV